MKSHAILARFACIAALALPLATPSHAAGKWAQIGGVWKYIDDLAAAGKALDGAAGDAANAGRKLDDAAANVGNYGPISLADEAADGAGGLAARAPVVYDKFIPQGAVDAAAAGKQVPTAILKVNNASPAGIAARAPDPADWDNIPGVANPLLKSDPPKVGGVASPGYVVFDPKLIKAVDANDLPALPKGLPDPNRFDVVDGKFIPKNLDNVIAKADDSAQGAGTALRRGSDGIEPLERAPRLAGNNPKRSVKEVKNGPGWSKRKKIIVGTSAAAATLVVVGGGGIATYTLYNTYEPATEKLDVFADGVRDIAGADAKLTVSNFTDDKVEVFETLFNSRKSLATLDPQEKGKEIAVKVGDNIEIDRNGASFTTLKLEQDEEIFVQ